MNFKSISYYLGLFCLPVCFLSFINIIYSSYFDYFLNVDSYITTLFISLLIGLGLFFYGKKSDKKLSFYEQLILIILVYLVTATLISIPFYLSNYQINFVNALFEAFSGITGTGFSIFENIKYLDPTLILWRSSSQWIGGLYFLIFLIKIFSNTQFNYKFNGLSHENYIEKNSEKLLSRSIINIFLIYFLISLAIFLLLSFSNIRLFNSLNLAMTLVSNGGFLPTNLLSQIIKTNTQELFLIFSLLISTLNIFLIFDFSFTNNAIKEHYEDLGIVLLVFFFSLILLITIKDSNLTNILINILTSLSNSGISINPMSSNLSLYFIILTMIGGSLISNSSGIKFLRIFILLKTASFEIFKLVKPYNITNKNMLFSEKKITDSNIKMSFLIFISFFISLLILSGILLLDDINFEKSFKLSILTLTNTVNSELYGTNNVNFNNLLTSSKISLIIFMIIGKIELISIFLIFKKFFFKN